MAFGKRGASPPVCEPSYRLAPFVPDADGVTRVISKTIFDGPLGELLRQYGMTEDDPRNLVLTPQRMTAMAEAAEERMKKILAKVNGHVPGVCAFLPWAQIPWSVWNGANAEFWMKHDFMPASPWNTMLLAADQKTSEKLGLPLHPRAAMPFIDENCTRLIDELRVRTKNKSLAILAAVNKGDLSALDDENNEPFQRLLILARHVSSLVFGEAALERHDELFGIGLAKVPE